MYKKKVVSRSQMLAFCKKCQIVSFQKVVVDSFNMSCAQPLKYVALSMPNSALTTSTIAHTGTSVRQNTIVCPAPCSSSRAAATFWEDSHPLCTGVH